MDLFLKACGASAPLQLSFEYPGSSGVDRRTFGTPYVLIGRDPHSDLVFDHKDVCPRHAYLQWVGGRFYCADLGSRIGITVGGQSRRAEWVEPGQTIRIGLYRIRVVTDDGRVAGPGSPDDFELPARTLDLSHRGFKTSECPIIGGVSLVGSSTDCPVRLLDPGVSNTHCSLISTASGVWVVDLFGKGGIRVNGVHVRHTLLEPGDEVRVGRSSIRIRPAVETIVSRLTRVATAATMAPSHFREEPPHRSRSRHRRPPGAGAVQNPGRSGAGRGPRLGRRLVLDVRGQRT